MRRWLSHRSKKKRMPRVAANCYRLFFFFKQKTAYEISACLVGSVDTTLLFNDGIMNPGVVTHFWEWPHRPTFDIGTGTMQLRNGQGGEDDVGPALAAIRVYT